MLSEGFPTQDAFTGLSNPGCCKPSCSDSQVPCCPRNPPIAGLVPNRAGVFTPSVLSLDAVLSGLSNPGTPGYPTLSKFQLSNRHRRYRGRAIRHPYLHLGIPFCPGTLEQGRLSMHVAVQPLCFAGLSNPYLHTKPLCRACQPYHVKRAVQPFFCAGPL